MKDFIFRYSTTVGLIFLSLILVGCNTKSDNQIAQEASINYIKDHMKNPDTFKILSVKTNLDTIPSYLSEKAYSALEEFEKSAEEANDFIPDYFSRSSLQKKLDLLNVSIEKGKELQSIVKESSNDAPDVQYLTCIKYNAANAIGGTLSAYSIVVASKNKPDSILGSYDLENDDFIERFNKLAKEFHGKEKFEKNKYGKIDTIGFSLFEKFIINTMQ